MEKKLEVKNLQISFRTQGGNVKAVRDISFDLYKGETLAIVGESGSGKSVTSKAVIGILAGNSIVEGGEILYDGQDLLKISEDDFHKIRGDKIAMIFQDPMSSLNPIMRVGKQLTEAMILKSKASQRNAKDDFNSKLELLNKNIDAVNAVDNQVQQGLNKAQCELFDEFCISSSSLENVYNEAHSQAIAAQVDTENVLFLLSKNQKVDLAKQLRLIKKQLLAAVHPYVANEQEVNELVAELDTYLDSNIKYIVKSKLNMTKSVGHDANNSSEAAEKLNAIVSLLNRVKTLLATAVERQKPNFFTLGYYMMKNPEANVSNMNIEELDKLTRKFLDDDFMLAFIELGKIGIQHSHEVTTNNKLKAINALNDAILYFEKDGITKEGSKNYYLMATQAVKQSINHLSVKKNSIEHSFISALNSMLYS